VQVHTFQLGDTSGAVIVPSLQTVNVLGSAVAPTAATAKRCAAGSTVTLAPERRGPSPGTMRRVGPDLAPTCVLVLPAARHRRGVELTPDARVDLTSS
jgi:hypothetical protein